MIYEEKDRNPRAKQIEYEVVDGCWICTSHKTCKDGYPKGMRNYKHLRLSRFIYEDYNNKKIKEGNFILHSCDNPSCINPEHLSEGTHTDNVRDMHRKGRAGTAKITFELADEIREKYKNGASQKQLSSEYELHNATISRIINNKIWVREDIMNMYDVVIVGAGASGLTTALYTARAGLNTLVIEKGIFGGQLQQTADIENYSGFSTVSGGELSEYMYNQAIEQGVNYTYGDVERINKEEDETFSIYLVDRPVINARSVVVATGVQHRLLGIKGEQELAGRGVSYCALCDGSFFKGKHIVVVGGGDSALEEANYLSQIADRVTIVHRRNKFTGQKILQERILNNDKIKTLMNCEVIEVKGDKKVESVSIKINPVSSNDITVISNLRTDAVFIYIGLDPITPNFDNLGILDSNGYIITNDSMETSVKGLFAVGDVRQKSVRQVATAVGDGAIAGVNVNKYLESL